MEPETVDRSCDSASVTRAQLAGKLAHILEYGARRYVVREQLLALSASDACTLMGEILRHPPDEASGSSGVRELLRDLLLSHPDDRPSGFPYEFRRDVYAAAVEREDEEVVRALRSLPAESSGEENVRRLPADLVDIPLGRRRSLAKGVDAHWLELLALDPDPIVVRNLLRNGRVREAEVIRIAALRPVAASTLYEIAESQRWSSNIRVRTALARNPHSPSDLAIRLLGSLPTAVLREMRGDTDLARETRLELGRELDRRSL